MVSALPKVAFYVAIKLRGRAGIQMSEDVQYGLLLFGEQQAFAFAGAVVGALAEAGYQVGDGDSPFVVGQAVQHVHEAFGVARLLTGAVEGAFPLDASKAFGADDFPVILFGRHALHGELAEAGGSLGTLFVEAQGVVEGDLGKGYFFFHK